MNFQDRSVIVVEDHPFQRRMTLRQLGQLGVEDLLEAAHGREALNLLMARHAPVDVILCDLDMPEMDGVEFISHVATNRLARALLVVSAMDSAILHTVETMARAYGIQVLESIPKPLTAKLLADRLERLEEAGQAPAPADAAGEPGADELRRGLESREFLTFFQPKVDLATGQPTGVETLVRWYRPGQGVLCPGAFISRLEAEGLMDRLTEHLLRQSCLYLHAWEERGRTLEASVNISMTSLRDIAFADRLQQVVLDEGCDPRRITLEVTESEVMTELATVLNVLARLRLKGFKLSIDDFGTGYSTLKQLNSLPFTELKLDQAFIQAAPQDPRSRAIVEASLELAAKLGLKTVAEGIETRQQWDFIHASGCQEAQGYFISRPMPGHQLPEWLALWEAPETRPAVGRSSGHGRRPALDLPAFARAGA